MAPLGTDFELLGLLAALHRGCLGTLAAAAGGHVEGVHQGIAAVKRRGFALPSAIVRRLHAAEAAAALARHITPFS
eukprot:7824886-Lingulodinium_polyedra.AAC.1